MRARGRAARLCGLAVCLLLASLRASAQDAPAEEAPAEEAPAEEAPPEKAPPEEAPPEEAPTEETPPDVAPTEQTPPQEGPTEETPPDVAPTEQTLPAGPTPEEPTPEEAPATPGAAPPARAPSPRPPPAPAEPRPQASEAEQPAASEAQPSDQPPGVPGAAQRTSQADAQCMANQAMGAPALCSGDGAAGPSWTAALSWGQGLNLAAFDRGSTLSYNPEYAWSFALQLGYMFSARTLLLVQQGLAIELTESELTYTRPAAPVTRQVLLLDDPRLTLMHTLVQHELAEARRFDLLGSAGLIFPLSRASQASELVLGTRGAAILRYSQQDLLKGLIANLTFAYTRRWASSNVRSAETGFPCVLAGTDASIECFHMGGYTTSRDLFLLSLNSFLSLTQSLAVGATLSLGWSRRHPLAGATLSDEQILTGGRTFVDTSETSFRNSRLLELGLSYAVNRWFSAIAYVSNSFPELGPDGEQRSPFRALDTFIGLILRLQIDQLYASARGASGARPN